MDKGTRRVLFYSSVVVFLLLSYGAVLLATGYVFDFKNFKFVKTGTLAFKSDVKGANVYFKNKKIGKIAPISGNFSKKYLLPGSYEVSVRKDGYQNWEKTAEIKSQEVTNFFSIVLVRKNPDLELLVSNDAAKVTGEKIDDVLESEQRESNFVQEFLSLNRFKETILVAPDNKKLAYLNNSELAVFWTEDQKFEPVRKKGDAQLAVRLSVPITAFFWTKDSEHLVYSTSEKIFITELDQRGGANTFEVLTLKPNQKLFFLKNKEMFIQEDEKLLSVKF